LDWTLTDTQGRSIKATIIGRDSNSITIVRHSDGKRFDLPVDRLSPSDQNRIAKLPQASAPAAETGVLKLQKAKLQELNLEINQLSAELSQSTSTMKSRSLNSQIDRLMNERIKLEAEIAEIEGR
jgi:hypothetical protein